nr:hypothetical protein [Tanacetum cinerariifolium]
MATTIEQQVALDEALVPSTQRFTKVIIHHFMSNDLSIPRRNKVNWHYVRDDMIFSTIKVVSRHQNTQQYGVMLPIELTNDEIRNTKAYKEYYACATGEAAPKPKASARRKRSGSDTSITPPTAITTPTTTVAVALRLTAAAKGKQPAKAKSPSDPSESVPLGTDLVSSYRNQSSMTWVTDLVCLPCNQSNKTMATTIEQHVALDEALVPSTQRCPFFKAFLVTADVPEVYMQELWATAYVHQRSIQFKMNNKKHVVDLELFREMLHICPRIPGQAFAELPFEEEILEFIRFLRHGATIRTLTDVNINKLYQPWRSFAAIINKCLTGKSSGYDSFWLSQAQILWGLYHTRSIDYAFLIWEDFVYQVEHKNQKKSNEMYYPRFTKVIIHHFISKDSSIPKRNKINWHYVRDDSIFSTIKVVLRHQNTQQYGAMLPIKLTNDEIRNTKAYKEYYAFATREAAPKPKASAEGKGLTAAAKGKQPAKAKSLSDPSEVARTKAQQLTIVFRRSRHQTHISQPGGSGTDEGTSSKPGVLDVPTDESEEELSWNSSDDEGADDQEKVGDDDEGDEGNDSEEGEEDDADDEDKNGDERDDNDQDQEIAKHDDKDDTEESGDVDEEGKSHEEDDNEETRDEESFDPIPQTPKSSEDESDGEKDQGLRISEEERLNKEEEAEELYRDVNINQRREIQATLDVEDSHVTLTLVHPDVQIQTNQLHDSYQRENDEFLRTIDANIKRIIKEQVKSQVKEQVSRILPRIEQSMNAQLEAEVLTRSSHSSRTSYAVAADLSEMELKKILIEKMEGNKSIQRSNEQRNIYKALVDAYEADKTILDSYGETIILKRRCDDDDQEEGPSAGSDRGSKRQREGKEPESASASLETATRSTGRSTTGFKSRQKPPTPDRDWNKTLPAVQGNTQTWISELVKQADSRSSFNELLDTPLDFSNFIMNRLRFYEFAVNRESALDVYSKRRIIAVTDLKIVEWHSYKHLDWIMVRRDDDKLYKFKEGDFKRMFTRSIVIQRRVEDLQLGLESYQKRLNLTKPDMYRSDMKRMEAYTAYSNPKGFIYQNKDKKNRLMQIDELHKFSDGMLNDVRNALDDRLKGIQAIDKMLKTRRIMKSLERLSNVEISSLTYRYFFVDQTPLPIIVTTMATTIDQQVALDESLVPSTQRLRIGRSNFRLPSDIQSKESTLQVVYDVLQNCPLFRAFQVTADVPEIYMQEFWATAKLHHNSIRFKIDTKKSVLDLESFREMLHISPRIPNQSFAELPSEEEILDFLRFLGHSHEIRYLTDVNVNKLYQPWRSFASVINKFLTGKSSGVDTPKPKASTRKKKGDSASSTTLPTPTPTTTVKSASRLSATAKGIGVSIDSDDTINDDTPIGVASAVQEGATPYVADMTVEMDNQNSLKYTSVPKSFPSLSTPVTTMADNAPGKSSYANVTGKPSGKKLNFRTLYTSWGNGINVVVHVESIRAINERFANTSYGFFLGKKVAYPIVANYVRNTWGKYGLVRSMFSLSIGLFFFQFSFMYRLDAMLENGPWFIQSHPLILKK